jgi:hypothetical protein
MGLIHPFSKAPRIHAPPIFFKRRQWSLQPLIKSIKTEKGYRFLFPEHPAFTLEATIEIPDPSAPPILSYRFTPKIDGYYSVGFTGAPAHSLSDVDEIWQPLIWQEKRFPPASYMELAYRCPVPTALVTHQGVTLGIVVDPEEFPSMNCRWWKTRASEWRCAMPRASHNR